MKKILAVDDDVEILKALSMMFMDSDYELCTAHNGKDALALIEAGDIDMVISDMHMPVLGGHELLSTVKEKDPKVIRVVLSGYAEESSMLHSLLHNEAKLYIYKPWNNSELLKNIDRLFADEVVLNSENLKDPMEENCHDCPIWSSCRKLISLIEAEDLDGFLEELDREPKLCALLLEVAESAVYGVLPKDTHKAAGYIGLHNLKSFMHWACIMQSLEDPTDKSFEPELLYKHAYLTNRIFLFIYETFLHKQPPEAAMFAGLLHNTGLIVRINDLRKEGKNTVTGRNANEYTMELDEDMLSHQETGGHLLEHWDLPFPMYEAALYHHRPLDPGIVHRELVQVLHIAQHYAWKTLGAGNLPPVEDQVFDELDLSKADFEKRLARYLK